MSLDKRIAHLSEEQIKDLMERYYANENVNALIEEFKIEDVRNNSLYKVFPVTVSEDQQCEYCNAKLILYHPSKSNYKGRNHWDKWECPSCGHKAVGSCSCDGCYEKDKSHKDSVWKSRDANERKN